MKLPISSPRQRRQPVSPGNDIHIGYANGNDDDKSKSKRYNNKKKKNVGLGCTKLLKAVKSRINAHILQFIILTTILLAVIYHLTRFKVRESDIEISIILLTYNKHKKLADLLPTVLFQRPFNFEIILVDNGCFDETQNVLKEYLFNQNIVPYKYLQLCHNPGYAAGNNAGVQLAAPTSTHLLFLNDDIVMSRSTFIHYLLTLQKAKDTSSAVGCKLLNAKGDELIEAGSIIWEDSSAAGYGRGRHDIDAPEFSFPRPVDYVSGACLLIKKDVFNDYGGFDGANFPNYYEDTDLQLHVQHDLGSEVWYQPKSVALHAEHGSFGNEKSERMMQEGAKRFAKKWGSFLKGNHVKPPFELDEHAQGFEFFKASDLRVRDREKAKILYIDDKTPNHAKGSGYGRSFDNLSMLAELGHRVTLITWLPREGWCDDECVDEITALGVEYVDKGKWSELVQSRIGYYDIVIVSRPSTFQATFKEWQDFYKQSSFSLVYDAEALWFRRSESQHKVVQTQGIPFPSYDPETKPEVIDLLLKSDQLKELALVKMADTVVTVSNGELNQLNRLLPKGNYDIEVIGHVMTPAKNTEDTGNFKKRKGILFLASFSNEMFYNGDAIWHFLKYTYKYFVEEVKKPTPLTIAGRGIPSELKDLVKGNRKMRKYVTFLESPPTLDKLFESTKMFIAPHLYGAGIQYKISEALSRGIPVVMSKFSSDSFGNGVPGCIGTDSASYQKCILELDKNRTKWEEVRAQSIDYIKRTHNREQAMRTWTRIIDKNMEGKLLLGHSILNITKECDEGEDLYRRSDSAIDNAVNTGVFKSGFDHWTQFGKSEGRTYYCNSNGKFHNLLRNEIPLPKRKCDEGEEIYLGAYPDIVGAIKMGYFDSGFHHWDLHGKREGRSYYCKYVFEEASEDAVAKRAKEKAAAAAKREEEAKAAEEKAAAEKAAAAAAQQAAEEKAAADKKAADEKAAAEKAAAEQVKAEAEQVKAEVKAAEVEAAAEVKTGVVPNPLQIAAVAKVEKAAETAAVAKVEKAAETAAVAKVEIAVETAAVPKI